MVREFAIFIFGAIMLGWNIKLVQSIQDEKKDDKNYNRQEKKEANQTLEKMLQTMDGVIEFKKTSSNDHKVDTINSVNIPGSSDKK